MNTAFNIDFTEQNIRARIPEGSAIDGTCHYTSGLLVEGALSGEITIDGPLVVLGQGQVQGKINIDGDAYLMGHIRAERMEVRGVVNIAQGAVLTGYVIAKDYQLFAGADVQASLHKLP